MLHFVTSYMRQNKSRKQTLESASTDWKSALSFQKMYGSWWVYKKSESATAIRARTVLKGG